MRPVFLSFLMSWIVHGGAAQDTLTAGRTMVTIPGALQLQSDPMERLYVTTAREFIQLGLDGAITLRLGGKANGTFVELSSADPGGGLIWVVADAGAGELLRFSHQGLHLESLPVPRPNPFVATWGARQDPRGGESNAEGWPTAVATAPGGELFAIEGGAQVVLKWDASRRLERVINTVESGLTQPGTLEVDENWLYVADRSERAVFVFDYFGSYSHRIVVPFDIVDLVGTGDTIWIAGERLIQIHQQTGELIRSVRLDSDGTLVSAVPVGDGIVVLTSGGHVTLYRDRLDG